ncbi:MAG TPA: ACT domain-containing protein [Puia sp.]|jgi:acetolactate synthase regulatory subunit|nr:ACT domain-containing protein [Puia sp.]
MELQVELKVVNSPTILSRVVETVKRRRINIKSFIAEEDGFASEDAKIKMIIEADEEKKRLLVAQLNKIVDVIYAQ